MSRDTKTKDERPADVHTSADPVIRDYVAQLRKKTESYSMPLAETRAAVDRALGQVRLTDALYKMRRDEDVV
jgi:hypothetical protein